MKKKILSCAMACTMVVPAAMALTGCGKGGDEPKKHNVTLEVQYMNDFASFVNPDNLVGTPGENSTTTFTTQVEEGKDYTFAFKYAPGFDHDGTVVKVANTELDETRVYYNDANKTTATGNIDFTVDRIIEYKISNVQADTTISANLDSYSVRYRVLTLDQSIVPGAKYMLSKRGFDEGYDLSDRSNFTQIYNVPANGEIVIDQEVYDSSEGCVLFLDANIDAIDLITKPLLAPADVNASYKLSSKTLFAEYSNTGNKLLYEGKTAFVLGEREYNSTVYAKQKSLTNYKENLKYNTGGSYDKYNGYISQIAHQDLFTVYQQATVKGFSYNIPFDFQAFSNISETVDIYETYDDFKSTPKYKSADDSIKLVSVDGKTYNGYNFKSASAYVGEGAIDEDESFIKSNAANGYYCNTAYAGSDDSKKFANSLGKNIYIRLTMDKLAFVNRNEEGFEMYNPDEFNYYLVGQDGTKTPITNFVTLLNSSQEEEKFAVITPEDYAKYLSTGYGRADKTYKQYKTGYAFFVYEPKQETMSKLIKVNVNCSDIEENGLDNVHISLGQYNKHGLIRNFPDVYLTKFSTFNPLNDKLTYYFDRKELSYINNVPDEDIFADVRLGVKLPIAYNRGTDENDINKVCTGITVTVTDQEGNVLIDNKTYEHPHADTAEDVILLDDFDVTADLTELTFDIRVHYDAFEAQVGGSKVYDFKIHDLENDSSFATETYPIFITKEFTTDLTQWTKHTNGDLGTIKVGDTIYVATKESALTLAQVERHDDDPNSLILYYHGVSFEKLSDPFTGDDIKIEVEENDKDYYIFKITIPENNFNHAVDNILYIENCSLSRLGR